MAKQHKKLLLIPLLVIIATVGALAFTIKRPRLVNNRSANKSERSVPVTRKRMRNISVQPEAFNLSRRLGRRFSSQDWQQTIVSGTLRTGAEQRVVNIIRRQSEDGERVEIAATDSRGLLTWSLSEGPMLTTSRATGSDRELIERLVFDSPDQFVLAQLRGTNYRTVARNVRPDEVGSEISYRGTLWDIVRVEESDERNPSPLSSFRLYFINSKTGLLDKVVSRNPGGSSTQAELSGWMDQDGEKVPTHIKWTQNGNTVMELHIRTLRVSIQ